MKPSKEGAVGLKNFIRARALTGDRAFDKYRFRTLILSTTTGETTLGTGKRGCCTHTISTNYSVGGGEGRRGERINGRGAIAFCERKIVQNRTRYLSMATIVNVPSVKHLKLSHDPRRPARNPSHNSSKINILKINIRTFYTRAFP